MGGEARPRAAHPQRRAVAATAKMQADAQPDPVVLPVMATCQHTSSVIAKAHRLSGRAVCAQTGQSLFGAVTQLGWGQNRRQRMGREPVGAHPASSTTSRQYRHDNSGRRAERPTALAAGNLPGKLAKRAARCKQHGRSTPACAPPVARWRTGSCPGPGPGHPWLHAKTVRHQDDTHRLWMCTAASLTSTATARHVHRPPSCPALTTFTKLSGHAHY
jgi:hypothetical protein